MKYIVELPNGYDAKLAAEACGEAADIIGRTQDEWVDTLCNLSRALHNAQPVNPPKTDPLFRSATRAVRVQTGVDLMQSGWSFRGDDEVCPRCAGAWS